MKCLTISSEQNQHFFLKKSWSTWFFSVEITLAGLWRSQAQAPHYFFRKKSSTSLFLQKKWGASLFLQNKKQCFCLKKYSGASFFLKKFWGASFFHCRSHTHRIIEVTRPSMSLFLEIKMRRLIISSEKIRHLIISSQKKISGLFWRNNAALQFFLKK